MKTERFESACAQSPIIRKYIYADGQWNPGYQLALDHINAACQAHEACDHGELHHFAVIQNALTLKDLYEVRSGVTVHDETVLLSVFGHDIGYGLSGTRWEENTALHHAEYGKIFCEWYWNRIRKSNDVLPDEAIIFSAMEGTTAKRLTDAESLLQSRRRDPSAVVPVMVKLADCFDYFRRQRVEHIQAPEQYAKNPYYFLAHAVHSYRLYIDKKQSTLHYMPLLDSSVDFDAWHRQTQRYCGANWQLARTFGKLLDIEFTVIPDTQT